MSEIRPPSLAPRRTAEGAAIICCDPVNTGPGPKIMAADTLKGDSVINSQGENLGKVEHIMLDVQRGRIAYAVLSFGRFLGMGNKLFAIPWAALTLNADQKCFVLDVPQDRLAKAPGFDKDQWPTMADPAWASELHTYYRIDKYY